MTADLAAFLENGNRVVFLQVVSGSQPGNTAADNGYFHESAFL
jgi:hypothetical protein